MFSHSGQFARAAGELLDSQAAFCARSVSAVMDAGVCAAESQVDALRTLFASATVATRQWLGTVAADWLTLVPHPPHHGWASPSAQPSGARADLAPVPGTMVHCPGQQS